RDAFGGQQTARGSGDRGQHVAGGEGVAVADMQVDDGRGIRQREGGGEHVAAAERAGLTGDEVGRRGRVGGQQRGAGEIAPGRVLFQGGRDDAVQGGGGEHQ